MIIVVEGLTGSGKTMFASMLVEKEWKSGLMIYPNFPLWYDNEATRIKRWHNLDETFHITNGVLFVDESQKVFDARRWQSLPMSFAEKVAMNRHHGLDLITTTQDLMHIDVRVRDNVHVLYHCDVIFRYPKNEKVKPLIQITRITKRTKSYNRETNRVIWKPTPFTKTLYISKYFTKTHYNTYGDVGQEKFLCKIFFQKKPNEKLGMWRSKLYSREVVDRGKARI